jgi:arsenate reductase
MTDVGQRDRVSTQDTAMNRDGSTTEDPVSTDPGPTDPGPTTTGPTTTGPTDEATMDTVTIWHNPRCSKSRGALALLTEHGVDPAVVRYLDDAPDRAGLERVLAQLGTDDPRAIVRTREKVYTELGLADADRETLLDALVAHPILIERPIVVVGDRAVVARPPEKALDLL